MIVSAIVKLRKKEDTLKLKNDIDRLGAWAKEMGYEIPTRQMQYDAANKETDQKEQCWVHFRGYRSSKCRQNQIP